MLRRALTDVPVGIALVTDQTLPALMPTTDTALFDRTLSQSVGIDRPPPSQPYSGRATTFEALLPARDRPLLLARRPDTGCSSSSPTASRAGSPRRCATRSSSTQLQLADLRPRVDVRQERIYVRGRADRGYAPGPDERPGARPVPQALAHGRVLRRESSSARPPPPCAPPPARAPTTTAVSAYARIALAPWFVLGGVLRLGLPALAPQPLAR